MARKRKRAAQRGVVVVRSSAPRTRTRTVVVRAPKQVHRRRRSGGSVGGGSGGKVMVASAIAGAAIGLIEKNNLIPFQLPMVGKKGTIALAAYFWRRNGGPEIARDVAIVAAGLAGYQFGKEGRIDGDDI